MPPRVRGKLEKVIEKARDRAMHKPNVEEECLNIRDSLEKVERPAKG
jgi:hypothetical protein